MHHWPQQKCCVAAISAGRCSSGTAGLLYAPKRKPEAMTVSAGCLHDYLLGYWDLSGHVPGTDGATSASEMTGKVLRRP